MNVLVTGASMAGLSAAHWFSRPATQDKLDERNALFRAFEEEFAR